MLQPATVTRLLLLPDLSTRPSATPPPERGTAARVRRYRLARFRDEPSARDARHAHLKASYD